LLVASGEESGTRRGALRCGDITVGEEHALAGQTVEMLGFYVLPQVMKTEVGIALIVGKDDDDIRSG